MIPDYDRTAGRTSQFRVRGPENWRALMRTRANMLVIGPRPALEAFVAEAVEEMSEPVWLVGPAQDIPMERACTFVMYDVSKLDDTLQEALLVLLSAEEPTRPQIISLSETHVWVDGAPSPIRNDLYYRLNTICLEVDSDPVPASARLTFAGVRVSGSPPTWSHRQS